MKWNSFGLLLLLGSILSCGELASADTMFVDVAKATWLSTTTDEAADFWARHGEVIIVTNNGGWVHVVPKDVDPHIGLYQGWKKQGTIFVDPDLIATPLKTKCVIAHEMGHALGLDHVNDPKSLMAPKTQHYDETDNLTDCLWSADDQKELCRVDPEVCND